MSPTPHAHTPPTPSWCQQVGRIRWPGTLGPEPPNLPRAGVGRGHSCRVGSNSLLSPGKVAHGQPRRRHGVAARASEMDRSQPPAVRPVFWGTEGLEPGTHLRA